MLLSELGEFGFLRNVTGDLISNPEDVIAGAGDDAAVFRTDADTVQVISTDTLVEGVDFLLDTIEPAQLGHKALAVNLSDIAAMGARPTHALVTIAAPSHLSAEFLTECYDGLKATAKAFGVNIIGGDMSSSPHDMMIGVTILGTAAPEHIVYRSGARPGDVVLLIGLIGESAAGLRLLTEGTSLREPYSEKLIRAHLKPVPLVAEGHWLGESGRVHAMIDVSDGIAPDLGHICEQSGVGAEILMQCLPVSDALSAFAERNPVDVGNLLLCGGEDFALLATTPPEHVEELVAAFRRRFDTLIAIIGHIIEGNGVTVVCQDGSRKAVDGGYEHFRSP